MRRYRRGSWRTSANRIFLSIGLLAVSGPQPAWPQTSEFPDGLAAFDAGDYRNAYEIWLPLAEAGDASAQVALAGLLETGGPGVVRDLPAAIEWYRLAARGGDPVAQMNLGEFLAQGQVVPRDDVRALAWFSLAAEQGQGWAARRRNELHDSLTAGQREQAARLALRLRAATQ
ncbi:tetratricopeptide repeat protein [Pelagibius sp. CAU 1746]|uniref:tetratricopeptide repeat protein n=1 Tax=Pelagibius sp. CAU 1746 TaxID=3140370 RepID=UPI00325B4AE3